MVSGFDIYQLLASTGDLSSDFSSEVLFLLLDALALNVVQSIYELNGTAQLLGSISNVALNAALEQVAADEVLLQQADFLKVSGNLTGSDLLLNLSRLAGHLGIVVHSGNLNSQLVVNISLRHQGL